MYSATLASAAIGHVPFRMSKSVLGLTRKHTRLFVGPRGPSTARGIPLGPRRSLGLGVGLSLGLRLRLGLALLASPLGLGALPVPARAGHRVPELGLLPTVLTGADAGRSVGAGYHPEMLAARFYCFLSRQLWPLPRLKIPISDELSLVERNVLPVHLTDVLESRPQKDVVF